MIGITVPLPVQGQFDLDDAIASFGDVAEVNPCSTVIAFCAPRRHANDKTGGRATDNLISIIGAATPVRPKLIGASEQNYQMTVMAFSEAGEALHEADEFTGLQKFASMLHVAAAGLDTAQAKTLRFKRQVLKSANIYNHFIYNAEGMPVQHAYNIQTLREPWPLAGRFREFHLMALMEAHHTKRDEPETIDPYPHRAQPKPLSFTARERHKPHRS